MARSPPSVSRIITTKGNYSIFAAFIFIVVAVALLMVALSLSGNTGLLKSFTGDQRIKSTIVRESYDTIVACHGSYTFAAERIMDCVDPTFVKALKVEQPAIDGCEERSWGIEGYAKQRAESTYNEYPLWVSVRQESGGKVCIARMTLLL